MSTLYSIGCDCTCAFITKYWNIRTPGPFDWVYNSGSLIDLVDVFSGNVLRKLLDKKWESSTFIETDIHDVIMNPIIYKIGKFEWIHEDLNTHEELCKILYRMIGFMHDLTKDNVYFMYCLNKNDYKVSEFKLKLLIRVLDELNINKDRFILLGEKDNELYSSYFNRYAVAPEITEIFNENTLEVRSKIYDRVKLILPTGLDVNDKGEVGKSANHQWSKIRYRI